MKRGIKGKNKRYTFLGYIGNVALKDFNFDLYGITNISNGKTFHT